MATWRVDNSTQYGGEVCSQWQANHAYSLGARCVCTTGYATTARRAYVYECTTAGTSHATTQPTWPTSGTVADGGVTWTTRSPNDGTWDNASCHFSYVVNFACAAGDSVFVSSTHSETYPITANFSLTFSTSTSSPVAAYSVNKSSGDALASGAVVAYTASLTYGLYLRGYGYCYGITFKHNKSVYLGSGDAASPQDSYIVLESDGGVVVNLSNTSEATYLFIGHPSVSSTDYSGDVVIRNGGIKLDYAGDSIISTSGGFTWRGGSLTGAVSRLFSVGVSLSHPSVVRVEDVDLSALGANYLADLDDNVHHDWVFARCKLHASTTMNANPSSPMGSVKVHHCGGDNATYHFQEYSWWGTVTDEVVVVRTDGASDGTTTLSQKMVSSANTKDGVFGLRGVPIHFWASSAASQTLTVEVVHDGVVALQDDEIWMEVEYPSDGVSGLGAVTSTRCAPLGTPADIPDSTATWTTTGLSNPNTRKLTATVDPGKVGPVTVTVVLAKPSTTVYVDPMVTVGVG